MSLNLQERYQLPDALLPFAGEINDTDGHEALPVTLWEEEYGSEVMPFHAAVSKSLPVEHAPDVLRDDTPITSETVWKVKLEKAPGAFDINRRLEVMDFTGVKRQILYPGIMGIYAFALLINGTTQKSIRQLPAIGRRMLTA